MVVGGVFKRVHGWYCFLGCKDNMGRDGECLILIIWWDFLTELKLGAGKKEDLGYDAPQVALRKDGLSGAGVSRVVA